MRPTQIEMLKKIGAIKERITSLLWETSKACGGAVLNDFEKFNTEMTRAQESLIEAIALFEELKKV